MAITNQINNSLAPRKPKFSIAIQDKMYQNLINTTLRDPKRANRFIANVMSAVANNSSLEECTAASILSAGLLGETLNLSPSPQLGQFYLVPYNDKDKGKVATFQIGYKGYIQLAIRSGFYKKMNVLSIKKGELKKYDPLNEEIEVSLIEDEDIREKTETIGYYAMFEYQNGFKKIMYWSKRKMEEHALKYSNGYRADKMKNTSYTFWTKNFDEMAYKTMLRQLISKWGIMSIEMQEAYVKDQSLINDDGSYNYVDNVDPVEIVSDEKELAKEKKVEDKKKQEFFDDSNLSID